MGDVNSDGVAELIIGAGFGGGPRVAIYDGRSVPGTFGTTLPTRLRPDFFLFEETLRNGAFVAVGDIDGDGFADIVGGGGPGGAPRVYILSGDDLLAGREVPLADFYAGDDSTRGGVRVTVANLDGDTRADVVVGSGAGAGGQVIGYLGSQLAPGGKPPERFTIAAFADLAGVYVG